MRIVLVRHGFSEGNLNRTYSGWTDVKLTADGIEELLKYKELYDYPVTQRYYSSDLNRCIHTFEVLFGDMHELHEKSDQLREVFFGEYENVAGDLVEPGYFDRWLTNVREADNETLSEFSYRILSKLEKILEDMKNDAIDSATIVCHSGVIKVFLIFLGARKFSDFYDIPVPNGLGYVLDLDYDEEQGMIELNHVLELHQKVE